MPQSVLFLVGDCVAGAVTGIATALVVRAAMWPGIDMVVAMLVGMGLGMVIHLILGVLFMPLLGMFETMVPGMFIGMYGGMLFGMRDAMHAGSPTSGAAILVGALFGIGVVLGVKYYDHVLRGAVLDTGEGDG